MTAMTYLHRRVRRDINRVMDGVEQDLSVLKLSALSRKTQFLSRATDARKGIESSRSDVSGTRGGRLAVNLFVIY